MNPSLWSIRNGVSYEASGVEACATNESRIFSGYRTRYHRWAIWDSRYVTRSIICNLSIYTSLQHFLPSIHPKKLPNNKIYKRHFCIYVKILFDIYQVVAAHLKSIQKIKNNNSYNIVGYFSAFFRYYDFRVANKVGRTRFSTYVCGDCNDYCFCICGYVFVLWRARKIRCANNRERVVEKVKTEIVARNIVTWFYFDSRPLYYN